MPGLGNPDAVRIWSQCDVFMAPKGTTLPVSSDLLVALPGAYKQVGILDEDQGVAWQADGDRQKFFGYGGGLIRTSFAKEALSGQFTPVENNAVVWPLANPGSEVTTGGGVTSRLRRPLNLGLAIVVLVFEFYDGDIKMRRIIPNAQCSMSDTQTFSDAALASTPITADMLLYKGVDDKTWFYRDDTNDPAAAVSGS